MKTPSLTDAEKRVVKRLISEGEKNQDVHHLVNIGRTPTVNFGRLSGSQEWPIEAASDVELARFRYEKSLFDLSSGLSPIDDEKIFRSREAMISAVSAFNSPSILFKVETFPVLSQIAWTYLLHDFYTKKGENIYTEDGYTISLEKMLDRHDNPLSKDVKKNLRAVKMLRDKVEHHTLNSLGRSFWPLFQANCLNYDKVIRSLFGDQAGLEDHISLALQFSKMSIEGLSTLQKYDVSDEIETIESEISEFIEETGEEGIGYKFKVNFSFEKSAKGDAHIVFTEQNAASEKKTPVLINKVVGDDLWPFKPNKVVELVREESGADFNSHHHTLAWKKFGIRPKAGASKPEATKKKFCHYHAAHKDYTYSKAWVEQLIAIAKDEVDFAELKKYKPKS